SGDIAIQDVASAAIKRLMVKEGTYLGDETGATGMWTMLSPDQSKVAFLWQTGFPGTTQLRVVGTESGSKSKVLLERSNDVSNVDPGGWSPDSKFLFVLIYNRDQTSQLARVSVSDGSVQTVLSLDKRRP